MIDIQKILSLPEGKTLEFKKDLSSIKPILKTLVAFANTAGGTLLIGRDDDGAIIGIDDIFEAEEQPGSIPNNGATCIPNQLQKSGFLQAAPLV